MYDHNSNLAYDLTLFDTDEEYEQRRREREKQRAEREKIKISQKKSIGRNGSVVAVLAASVFCLAVAFSLLYSKLQISDYTTMISETKNEIEQMERDNIRLRSELDSMYTLDNVEQVASQDLGLQKTQSSQITYITMNTEEMTEVAEENTNIFVSIKNWFYDILDYLGFKA
jgi:cell division protein FtsL